MLNPACRLTRAAFLGFEFATGHLPMPRWARWICFQRAQDSAVRLTRLRWIRDHRDDAAAFGLAPGVYAASELPPGSLIGTNGLEQYRERSLRWCEPVTVLRIANGARWQTVSMGTGGVRGDPLTWVTGVYANGRRVPGHALHTKDDRLVIHCLPCPQVNDAWT